MGTDELLETYQKLQLNSKKATDKPAYMVCKIAKSKIVCEEMKPVSELKDVEERHKAFSAKLMESGQPRYGMIDFDGKVFFISWIPETSKVKNKMQYASVREAFLGTLTGVQYKIQATEDSEIVFKAMKDMIKEV